MNAEMCLIPLSLLSGTIEGAEQWESCKALRRAMKTGKAADVRAAGAAIMRDMKDPGKAKAYNEGMRRAEISARMGQILRRDNGEIGKLVGEAIQAKKEADRIALKAEQSRAALRGAQQALRRAARELAAGVNKEAAASFRKSRAEIIRLKAEIREREAEIGQKKAEMKERYGQAIRMAEGQARREMLLDVQRAQKGRRTGAQELMAKNGMGQNETANTEQTKPE